MQFEEITFSPGVARVLTNMGEALLSVHRPSSEGFADRQAYEKALREHHEAIADMSRSLGMVLKTIASPGVKVWPDNGREDCLSLSGSMGPMSFGIICSTDKNGVPRWTMHS